MRNKTVILLGFCGGLLGVVGCPDGGDDDDAFAGCQSDLDCRGDRICVDGMCMFDDDEGASDGGAGPSSGGGSVPVDSGGADGDEPGGDGDGNNDSDSDGNSCSGDETACAGPNSMSFCVDGTFETYGCSDVCGYYGFTAEGCSGDFCTCGQPLNDQCAWGAAGVCACFWGEECDDDIWYDLYFQCYHGDMPEVHCAGQHTSADGVSCQSVVSCF